MQMILIYKDRMDVNLRSILSQHNRSKKILLMNCRLVLIHSFTNFQYPYNTGRDISTTLNIIQFMCFVTWNVKTNECRKASIYNFFPKNLLFPYYEGIVDYAQELVLTRLHLVDVNLKLYFLIPAKIILSWY
jgi:hypothetical protein